MFDISVIVPIYNGIKYIEGCVSCLINQSIQNIEIVLVNDGSTDGSLCVMQSLQKKYKNIKVLTKDNSGLSDTRNFGLRSATGKYIFFLDVDDFLSRDALQKMLDVAEERNLDIVTFSSLNVVEDTDVVNEIGDVLDDQRLESQYLCRTISSDKVYEGIEFVAESLESQQGFFAPVWLSLYNRDFLVNSEIVFTSMIHEDNVFSMDIYLAAKRVLFLDEVLHFRRIVSNSITNRRKTELHAEGAFIATQHAAEIYRKFSGDKRYREAFKRWGLINAWLTYTELESCDKSIRRKNKMRYMRYFITHPYLTNYKMILKTMIL